MIHPPRRLAALVTSLLAALALASPALACEPQVSRISAPRNDGYEPFSPDIAVYALDIDIRNRGDERCELKLVVLSDKAGQRALFGSGNGGQLAYDLTIGTGIRVPNEQSPGFAPAIAIPARSEQTVRLQLRINPGQVVPAGHYDEQLRLRLFDAHGADLANERRVPVGVRVQSRAQVNIAGSAGRFAAGVRSAALDLGSLERGATGRLFVQVRANDPVTLQIVSQNRGRLIHAQAPDQSIGYRLTIDGRPIDLTRPAILSRSPPRTLEGAAYEAVATVPPLTDGRQAGEYRDLVTITVDAAG